MGFFARPRLSNDQFVQHTDDVLTLSGQTQIASTTGFTLADGTGGTVIVTASGSSVATTGHVLGQDADGVIKLVPSAASGASTYLGASPTTCEVGGLSAGTTIYNTSIQDILEEMLVPTLDPALTDPSISSFTIAPTTTVYEVGCAINLTLNTTLSLGSINPVYPPTACGDRSNSTTGYSYTIFGAPAYDICAVPTASRTTGVYSAQTGANTVSVSGFYCGGVQPYDSSGSAYDSPLVAGNTPTCSRTITGVYPWYWGKITCAGAAGFGRPTAACIKHEITGNTCGGSNTGNKEVEYSTGTIATTFNTTPNDYLWFAIPNASTSKTWWYVDALNNAAIGGVVSPAGNLFPDPDTVTGVTSAGTGSWSGQSYKVYVSNKQSCSTAQMELRNL